jgi:ergothioneine biosynthesis protein EgtB
MVRSVPDGTLAQRYCEVRSLTEALAAPLSPEDQTVQSMPDVSPTKWHRGHTTWFFEEFVLGPHDPSYEPFHPDYGYLFNSYYETVGPRHRRDRRGVVSRPGVDEVASYRQSVDAAVLALLDADPTGRVVELLELGLHHEQQHQELLLMDIKHVLAQNPSDPPYLHEGRDPSGQARGTPAPRWVEHRGGQVEVGAPAPGFAFDNERPRHEVLLPPFALAAGVVTCGEWLAFMDDGGYQRPELWLSDGWATVTAAGWEAPLYWEPDVDDGGTWTTYTLRGRLPVEEAEPVCHVSYYEADAFARWSGARLPTEAEWEQVAATVDPAAAGLAGSPADQSLHPRPAPDGEGPRQLYGEVWQWTSSPYTAYPGFRPAAGAVGEYNGKFMVNQQVLRGGCCATPAGHVRATYRNFFPAAARWAFSGLRLARDAS